MPVPLAGSASRWVSTGTGTPNSGVVTVPPASAGVPLVVRVRDQRHAGGQQLGPGGGHRHRRSPSGGRGTRAGSNGRPPRGPPARPGPPRCRNVTSHSDGPSARYASPRARLRRNARCDTARAASPMVRYWVDQSTDSPSRRHDLLERLLVQVGQPLGTARRSCAGRSGPGHPRAGPAARTPGRRAAWDHTARGSSSAPGARWAGRCRPSRSGRTPPCRASGGNAPPCRCG